MQQLLAQQLLTIAAGGALGAIARFGLTAYAYPVFENRFPLGTFLANFLGSLLIGICYVLIVEKEVLSPEWRNFLMTGFLGAFTTFSTFSLDTLNLWQNGHFTAAVGYSVLSVTTCLIAVAVGAAVTLKFLN
ncbi:MAG: fluoride efflux transporter CrcB [Cellvibrionaceae bacterium]